MTRWTQFGLIGWLALTLASPLVAQPFTYQGFLQQNGQPVNGTTSLTFRLYDALTGGNQLGSAITQNVNVQNGLFTVVLDFGAVWTGGDRYLEMQVGSTTLAPRVKITPAPYASFAQRPWQTAGSNIFYNDGNVGIGTSSPTQRLHVEGNGYFRGYVGIGTIPTEPLHVVSHSTHSAYFENDSYGCIVVYGRATNLYGGESYGVMGSSRSTAGRGVGGWTYATEGETFGVIGVSMSPNGHGVGGRSTSSWGPSNGVFGENFSTAGRGVAGLARAHEGITFGVWGESWSPSGRGVYGLVTSHEGTTFGVYGESRSPDGRAVYGLASATSGWNFGVAGESRSPDGLGGWFGSAGKKGARVVGQGHIFREDWPANWNGGLETWDIVCAGIRYDALEARSDIRLKRDIQSLDASSELQRLMRLRPVSYYWRDERLPQTMQYGFIAQELREVFPELVSEGEDDQRTLAVNYQALIPLLVNALQVQQEQIRQQEARIQKLEAELQRLQGTSPK